MYCFLFPSIWNRDVCLLENPQQKETKTKKTLATETDAVIPLGIKRCWIYYTCNLLALPLLIAFFFYSKVYFFSSSLKITSIFTKGSVKAGGPKQSKELLEIPNGGLEIWQVFFFTPLKLKILSPCWTFDPLDVCKSVNATAGCFMTLSLGCLKQ